ncbi:MAG: DUF4339 domain-containing protein [Planctomycetes bacterium]|nr:DUF4339 domain-containing protein [Planctomycetota bacterium]
MGIAINVIIAVVGGVVCAAVAASKGRNAVGWFFFGFLLPLPGIIVVLVVANLKTERARFEHAAAERRRLREELRLERMRNQQFRSLAQQRLDVHDRALGVDTRHLAPSLGAAGDPVRELGPSVAAATADPPLAQTGAPPVAPPPAIWHYATHDGVQRGPVPFEDLCLAWQSAEIDGGSLVWRAGWKDWHRVADVPELLNRLEV